PSARCSRSGLRRIPTPCVTRSSCSSSRRSNGCGGVSLVAVPSLNESELRFLRALLRRKVRFMIVGLSAAALQGAPVVTQDVDLWLEDLSAPQIREALRQVGAAYVPPSILNPPMFAGGGVELFDIVLTMHGLGTFSQELQNCVDVALGRHKLKVLRVD